MPAYPKWMSKAITSALRYPWMFNLPLPLTVVDENIQAQHENIHLVRCITAEVRPDGRQRFCSQVSPIPGGERETHIWLSEPGAPHANPKHQLVLSPKYCYLEGAPLQPQQPDTEAQRLLTESCQKTSRQLQHTQQPSQASQYSQDAVVGQQSSDQPSQASTRKRSPIRSLRSRARNFAKVARADDEAPKRPAPDTVPPRCPHHLMMPREIKKMKQASPAHRLPWSLPEMRMRTLSRHLRRGAFGVH